MTDQIGIDVSISAELDRFEQNMRQAGRLVETTTAGMDKSTKRAGDAFSRLESRIDPAAKAAARLERDTQKVQLALQKGATTADRAAKVQAALNKQYENSIARLGGLGAAITKVDAPAQRMASNWNNVGLAADGTSRRLSAATTASRNMGFAVQGAGYQIGDFAVQVASGQGVLRPFIQQGTQMISMFGPWGAVIGAAGAVVGALTVAFTDADDAAGELVDSLERVREVQEELNGVFENGVNLSRQDIAVTLRQAEAADALARSEISLLQAKIEQRREEATATRLSATPGSANVASILESDISDAQDRLEKFLVELDNSQLAVKALRDAQADLTTETQDYNAELDQQIRLAGMAERARFAETKVLEAQAAAQKEGRALTEAEADAIRTKAEALYDLTDAQKSSTKATKDAGSEAKRLQRQRDRLHESARDTIAGLERENRIMDARLRLGDDVANQLAREIRQRETLGPLYEENADKLRELNAANDNLTEALERQQEQQREVERAAREAAAEMERNIARATDTISDAFERMLFDGGNAFDVLKDIARQTFMDIARNAIIRPTVQAVIGGGSASGGGFSVPGFGGGSVPVGGSGGLGGGIGGIGNLFGGGGLTAGSPGVGNAFVDVAQFFGAGANTQAAFGNAGLRLSSPVGAIGGFAGNFAGNALFGSDRGIGADIGGSLGAIAGSFIPIPGVGTFLGSLAGNALGGLIGQDVQYPFASASLAYNSSGRLLVNGTQSLDGGDASRIGQLGQAVVSQVNAILDATGARIGLLPGAADIGFASGRSGALGDGFFGGANFGGFAGGAEITNVQSPDEIVSRTVSSILQRAVLTGVSPEVANAIKSGNPDQAIAVVREIESTEDAIAALKEAMSGTADPLEEIAKQFDTLRASAVRFGLDVATIDRAIALEQERYSLGIEQGVLNQVGSELAAIDNFRLNRALSGSATPLQRVDAAQEAVQASLDAVRDGTTGAVGGLLQNANTLLQVGAQAFGTATPEFAALERFTDKTVASVANQIGDPAAIQDRVTAAIEAQTNTQSADNQLLREEVQGLRTEIRVLARSLSDLQAA